MNRGFVEPRPKREWFVVERFSAVVAPLRHGRKFALKRSTTNLTEQRLPAFVVRPSGCPLGTNRDPS